jgi:hypothetical protein
MKVCDILDNYTKNIEKSQDHIAYDILDCNILNENSVESLYQRAEVWIEDSKEKKIFYRV